MDGRRGACSRAERRRRQPPSAAGSCAGRRHAGFAALRRSARTMWKRDQGVPPSPQPEPHVDPARVPAAPAPEIRVVTPSADRTPLDLGKSVVIKGELSGSEDLTLHGQMQGKISLPEHTLTIGA